MNGNDFNQMMEAMKAWNTFKRNHPKFEGFMKAVRKEGVKEGTILSLSMETPEGKKLETNVKIVEGDMEMLEFMKKMRMF